MDGVGKIKALTDKRYCQPTREPLLSESWTGDSRVSLQAIHLVDPERSGLSVRHSSKPRWLPATGASYFHALKSMSS